MIRNHRLAFLVLTALLALCFVSCNRGANNAIPLGEQELPDMIMREASYVFGEVDRRPLIMNAETITIYSGENGRTLLEKATFVQEEEDENGQSYVEMSGQCDNAYINSDNSIAKMSGNVRLEKKTDNFTIECDSLEWDDDKQIITSESTVHVIYEDGTELKAIGFYAQLDDNIYEFGQIIEGRYTNNED